MEYLILIEEQNSYDVIQYNAFFERLKYRNIPSLCYYYLGNPLTSDDNIKPEKVLLETLYNQNPHRTLVIFGYPQTFLNSRDNTLHEWTEILTQFPQRFLFLPRGYSFKTERDELLKTVFDEVGLANEIDNEQRLNTWLKEVESKSTLHQKEASEKNITTFHIENSKIIPEMIFVEGGIFQMGSNDIEHEQPIHQVDISSFYIGKYPITVKEYLAFCEATNSNYPKWLDEGNDFNIVTKDNPYYRNLGYESPNNSQLPIIGINWDNARAYCQWLSKETNQKYRLPSEAQWEYAARGGNQSKGYKYSGSDDLEDVGWYSENSDKRPHPVNTGEKKPNELGVYHLSGNVSEWCEDSWSKNYKNASKNGEPWRNEGISKKIVRGGSFSDYSNYATVSRRTYSAALDCCRDLGFRVIREEK